MYVHCCSGTRLQEDQKGYIAKMYAYYITSSIQIYTNVIYLPITGCYHPVLNPPPQSRQRTVHCHSLWAESRKPERQHHHMHDAHPVVTGQHVFLVAVMLIDLG